MLNELQAWLRPYLGVVGENKWLQALLVMVCSLLLAWIFVRFVSSSLHKLAGRTRFRIDDHLITNLHSPVHTSVLLLGTALALNLLQFSDPYAIEDEKTLTSIQRKTLLDAGWIAPIKESEKKEAIEALGAPQKEVAGKQWIYTHGIELETIR